MVDWLERNWHRIDLDFSRQQALAFKMAEERETTRIEKLQSVEKWPMYKFQIRVILKANELWEIVSGESKKPEKKEGEKQDIFDENLKVWNLNDSKAQKYIVTSLGYEPTLHVMNCGSASEMWATLETVYEQKSQTSIQMLLEKYYSFTKDPGDSMAVHVSKLRNLVQQLKDLGEVISDKMVIARVLSTLPSELGHFHSAWESTAANDQTIENLTSRLSIEELRLESMYANESADALFVRKYGANGRLLKCFNCNKRGHIKRDCPNENSVNRNVKRGDPL